MTDSSGIDPASLLGSGTWIKQGPATLLLRENAWVVLVPGLRKQVTEAAWTVLGEKPAPEDFLDRLVEVGELGSADKLTALLFGFHDGDRGVFGVKGKTPIAVYTAEGSQQIAGTEDEPFVLRTLDGVRRTAFGDLPPEDVVGTARLGSGIVPARGFVHVTIDPSELEESERAALAEQVEADGRSIEDPEARKRRAERPAPAPKPAATGGTTPSRKPAVATRKSGEMPPSLSRGGTGSGRSSGSSSASSTSDAASSAPNMFEGLFGDSAPKHSPTPQATPGSSAGSVPATAGSASAAESAPPAPASSATAAPAAASTAAPTGSADTAAPTAGAGADSGTAAPGSSTSDAEKPAAPRRRLVSTSLFDRKKRSSPKPATADPAAGEPDAPAAASAASAPEPAAPASEPAAPTPEQASPVPAAAASAPEPTAPSPEPAAPSSEPAAPSPEAAAPSPEPAVIAPGAGASAVAPSPAPSAAIPTPEPPADEDDDQSVPRQSAGTDALSSPVTKIAPIDDGEDEEDDEAAPRTAAPASSGPAATSGAAPHAAPAPARVGEQRRAEGDLENTGAYDDLFGKTVFRRIEDAAVRRTEEEDEEESEQAPAPASAVAEPSPPESSEPEESAAPAPEPETSSAPSEFIDWVPGVGRAAPEIAQAKARRDAAPPAPEPAYPQVHMAERPPAPNTGSRPAPSVPPTAYEQSGAYGAAAHGHAGMYGQAGQHSPYGGPMSTGAAGQQVGFPGVPGQSPQYPYGPTNPGAAGYQLGFPGPQQGGQPAGPSGRPGQGAPQGGNRQHPHQQQYPDQQHPTPQHGGSPHGGPQAMSPQNMAPRQGQGHPQGMPPQAAPGSGASPYGQGPTPQQPAPHRPMSHQPAPQQSAPQRPGAYGGAPGQGRHASAPHPVAPSGPPSAAGRPPAPTPAQGSGPSSAGSAGQVTGGAVALPGLVCANGHANSPERAACRVCGAPLHGETRTVARPPLGAVTVSGGERFVLDRSAIIGRRPRASRVSAQDMPQLITVPSPQQDISRSHLELRLEGWHVVALDLGTTNGTTLYREGFEPVRLRSREGVVLHDGDHLDLGDDVHLVFREKA